jgi:hypothetical protein
MAYARAVVTAIAAGLLLGAGIGAFDAFTGALARLRPEDRATVLAWAISEAMNCAAFFVLVFVPLAVVVVLLRRRWRGRMPAGDAT